MLSPGVPATPPAATSEGLPVIAVFMLIISDASCRGAERVEERRRVDAAQREAGVVQRVDLLHHFIGQRVELRVVVREQRVARVDQAGETPALHWSP